MLGFSDKYDSSSQNLSMIDLTEGLGYSGSFHKQTSSGREKVVVPGAGRLRECTN